MEWVPMLLFVTVILVLMAGVPVAFTLGGVALMFAAVGVLAGGFTEALLSGLPNRIFGIMTNETLVAVPLFVFMGVTLERARIAEELLEAYDGSTQRILLIGGFGGCADYLADYLAKPNARWPVEVLGWEAQWN